MRRGWVQAMRRRPAAQPASISIFGSCVVLPEPVSPHTIVTALFERQSTSSRLNALIGNPSGYEISIYGLNFTLNAWCLSIIAFFLV
jgi:hypothetical protein